MTLFAIDPGPHTGIFWVDDDGEPRRITFDYTNKDVKFPLRHLYQWASQTIIPSADRVILESFEFRKDDAKHREYIDYSTGEFVGVIKLFCQLNGVTYVMQQASQAKGFWDDDKLKRVGLWVPGKDARHVRDATRHWLHYTTFGCNDKTWLLRLK